MQRRSVWLVLAVLGLSMGAEAFAQNRVRFINRGIPPGQRYDGPVIGREHLRQCVIEMNGVNAGIDALNRDVAAQNATIDEMNRLARQINAARPRVNPNSQASIDAYNALVNRHRRAVAAHNGRVGRMNAQARRIQRDSRHFNDLCANRVYYDVDMRAALRGY